VLTILTGLLSSLAYATSDMLSQHVSRATSVVRLMVWVLGVGVVCVVPAALLSDGLPGGADEWRSVGVGALSGCIYVGAYFSLLAGLQRGDLSLVTSLSALQGAFAAAAAILLGESVTPLVAAGLVLAVAGGTLAAFQGRPGADESGDASDGESSGRPEGARTATAGAGWALLSGVLFAVVVVLYDYAQSLSWLSLAAVSRLSSFLVVVPLALAVGRGALPGTGLTPRLRGIAVGAGLLEILGLVSLTISVSLGPLAVASVMVSQFATFGVLLGLVVLRERPRPHQLVGVVCTIVAVSVLALA
jgi:drug/metabolite transporter (DMT)-like permease